MFIQVIYRAMQVSLTPLLRILWPMQISGTDNVPLAGPAIIAANHSSFCDSIFVPSTLRRRVTYIAKDEYFRDWKTAWFFRGLGQIPIDRTAGSSARDALSTAARVVNDGGLIAIYPEGTRTPAGQVYKGKAGVARIAAMTGAPVIPVGVRGTEKVQPVDAVLWRPFHRLEIRFGRPMPKLDPSANPAQLREFTQDLMKNIAELAGVPYVDTNSPRRSSARAKTDLEHSDVENLTN